VSALEAPPPRRPRRCGQGSAHGSCRLRQRTCVGSYGHRRHWLANLENDRSTVSLSTWRGQWCLPRTPYKDSTLPSRQGSTLIVVTVLSTLRVTRPQQKSASISGGRPQVVEMLLISDHSRMKLGMPAESYDSTGDLQVRLLPIAHPEDTELARETAMGQSRRSRQADPDYVMPGVARVWWSSVAGRGRSSAAGRRRTPSRRCRRRLRPGPSTRAAGGS
jgi:hypothetical protein